MISQVTQKSLQVLGQLLKANRQQKGWSQANLAECLGVSRQTVMAMENGQSTVAIGQVFEAAYLLGVPLMANDNSQLTQWSTILAGFAGILPQRVRQKKVDLDDSF